MCSVLLLAGPAGTAPGIAPIQQQKLVPCPRLRLTLAHTEPASVGPLQVPARQHSLKGLSFSGLPSELLRHQSLSSNRQHPLLQTPIHAPGLAAPAGQHPVLQALV